MLSHQVKPHPCKPPTAGDGARGLGHKVSLRLLSPSPSPSPFHWRLITLSWNQSCGFRKQSSKH